MATLIGMRSVDAVTSSWAVIWKQPSPSIAHTVRSGRPTLAPMAAGTREAHRARGRPSSPRCRAPSNRQYWRRPHLVLADARTPGSCPRARRRAAARGSTAA